MKIYDISVIYYCNFTHTQITVYILFLHRDSVCMSTTNPGDCPARPRVLKTIYDTLAGTKLSCVKLVTPVCMCVCACVRATRISQKSRSTSHRQLQQQL